MNKLLLNAADFLGAIFGLIAIVLITPFIIVLGTISTIMERK